MASDFKLPNVQDLVKGGLDGIINGASKIISNFKADPTKVAEAESAIEQLRITSQLESQRIANQLEQIKSDESKNEDNNISDRWKADMTSDSKLSKYTRPIIVLSLLGFIYIIIVTDSVKAIDFDVKKEYVDLLSTLLVTVIIAYFSSRGVEKYKALHEMKNN